MANLNSDTVQVRLANQEKSIINSMVAAYNPVRNEIDTIYDRLGDFKEGDNQLAKANERGNLSRSIRRIVTAVTPILVLRDNRLKRSIENEYDNTWATNGATYNAYNGVRWKKPPANNWFRSGYWKTQTPEAMLAGRNNFLGRLNATLYDSLQRGISVNKAAIEVDKVFGFRDSTGKLIVQKVQLTNKTTTRLLSVPKSGEIYNSIRIARTEIISMHNLATVDAMQYAKDLGIDTRLQLLAYTADGRARPQSAQMDGDISDKQGRFRYPDGNWYFLGQQPAQWRINDRETTIPYDMNAEEQIDPYQNMSKASAISDAVKFAAVYGLSKKLLGTVYEY